ncbi:hypothetical protein Z959_08010 [Clostridium novyi B str. ATCC 27606]|uniref:Uncharacterized protein n=2 Tax=Clostridium TaxID=1485 RepID=A0AA40IUS3_CLONO|nr:MULTISPECIES: hypothetical protein [Clostridium]KEI14955.1 hypothetical protein Z958_07405 [Clostridium novyi B str. NCTC 9691]KEI15254.1 hypothetical protein Z960_01355 [Clostridium haemolyticum NCTC 9693]KEI17009.1 hypothetical protein Z959_08010 [Clostridium novyi B str. ATCC 27606]KGN04022.1 hypothetical protein Z961_05420 [Clostridium haemolyticum NCTC 8350]OOB75418.1 hypothetical protein AXF41_01370 [Clostridium haemolyticum]
MGKIKNVKVNYPTTKEGMEKLQRNYTKTLANILVKNYPPEVIEELIKRLENDNQISNIT